MADLTLDVRTEARVSGVSEFIGVQIRMEKTIEIGGEVDLGETEIILES